MDVAVANLRRYERIVPAEAVRTVLSRTRRAAVLVPIFEKDGQIMVLLTVRASHLRSHAGEVSLPGGVLTDQ